MHNRFTLGSKLQLQQKNISYGANFQIKDTPDRKQEK